MISKAQPKEGLETGGLISGSEAARARIAAEYEPDLSGANGPTARFDTLRELITTEIGAAQNEMTFASGDGGQIFGRGGRFAVASPSGKRGKGGVATDATTPALRSWDITSDGSASVTVTLGTITDVEDLTAAISIAGSGSPFSVAAGDYIWLKVEYDTGTSAMTVTMESGSSWPGHPKAYEVTGSGATTEWVATSYLLYKFTGTSTSTSQAVGSGVHAERLIGHYDLAAIATNYQSGTDKPVTGFTLVPYPKSAA